MVEGVAVSASGEVYEGVRVALAELGAGAGPEQTLTTGEDGVFKFTNVRPGSLRLTLTSTGFQPKAITATLRSGEIWNAGDVVLAMGVTSSDVHVTATQDEIAVEQVKVEETQRVLGIVPNFYVVYDHNAAPMTSRLKWQMTWKTVVDPVTILASAGIAGGEQASNSLPGYGQGAAGYSKRFAANYADTVINTVIGSAILPVMLKQDPRYFYKGTGTVSSRVWYAIANSVICKGDNGKWQPNYSAIVGGLASGAISNLYYPANDVSAKITFEGAALGTVSGAIQNLFQEFVVKKLTPGFRKNGS
jgi:hypothetical protein